MFSLCVLNTGNESIVTDKCAMESTRQMLHKGVILALLVTQIGTQAAEGFHVMYVSQELVSV